MAYETCQEQVLALNTRSSITVSQSRVMEAHQRMSDIPKNRANDEPARQAKYTVSRLSSRGSALDGSSSGRGSTTDSATCVP